MIDSCGFCLWDSKLTDYDVASSSCTTDVVGAVAEACKKYGLKFGLYYSLWDRMNPLTPAKTSINTSTSWQASLKN